MNPGSWISPYPRSGDPILGGIPEQQTLKTWGQANELPSKMGSQSGTPFDGEFIRLPPCFMVLLFRGWPEIGSQMGTLDLGYGLIQVPGFIRLPPCFMGLLNSTCSGGTPYWVPPEQGAEEQGKILNDLRTMTSPKVVQYLANMMSHDRIQLASGSIALEDVAYQCVRLVPCEYACVLCGLCAVLGLGIRSLGIQDLDHELLGFGILDSGH